MQSTESQIVVGRARHSETELPHELVLSNGRVSAKVAAGDGPETWLSDRWEELVPRSALCGMWIHYKNASYTVHGEARTDDDELIVYTSSDGRVWLRPAEMWEEHVTVGSYSGPRFRREGA